MAKRDDVIPASKLEEALEVVERELGVKLRRRPIDELKPDPRNMRKHSDRNKSVIAESLREVGAGRSLVTDAHDVTRAGNATMEAARAAGIHTVIEVATDGEELLVHKRRDLTDERQGKRLALADNAASDLSEWDADAIRDEVEEDASILDGILSESEQSAILDVPVPKGEDSKEVDFAQELLEAHNYVVLYFDNEMDWQAAQQVLGLETVKSLRSKGAWMQRGVGRVIKGAPIVAKLARMGS